MLIWPRKFKFGLKSMYRVITVEDRIRVPPEKLGLNVTESVKKAIQEKVEGLLDPRLGVLLSIVAIDKIGEGKEFAFMHF